MRKMIFAAVAAALAVPAAFAGVPRNLPLPSATPGADEIIKQVYYVNHFYGLKNFGIVDDGGDITVIVNKEKGSEPKTLTVERYLNNDYPEGGEVKAQDLAIFRSGKLNGTGMLITDYTDDAKSQSYAIWIPAIRKIRRFAQPDANDAWGGTDFTFEDVVLRKPEHEKHELQGTATFEGCLGAVSIAAGEQSKYTQNLPKEGSCVPKGKKVYKVKSTPNRDNWPYDYRVSYVDAETFADYRVEYFKGGKQFKVIDKDWKPLPGGSDKRMQAWGYWYGKNLDTEHETWAVIPSKVIRTNQTYDADWWSENTLQKIKQ
jgi:hypothetical protein